MNEIKVYEGYHGTSKKSAVAIEKGNFRMDFKRIGWLGTGIYLFQSNPELARYWSHRKFLVKGIPTGLLEVLISIPENRVLDVSDPLGEGNKYYQAVRKQFVQNEARKRGFKINVRNDEDLDGKVYNLICIKDRYEMVRGVTVTPDDQDRDYRLNPHTPNGVELCLRNVNYITSKKQVVDQGGEQNGT